MQYKVEEEGQLTKTIQVTVPVEEVDAAIRSVALKYRNGGNIPGFRKGKAPLALVEKQYSNDITPEATGNLIDEQVHGILDEIKLEPASSLKYDAGHIEKGKEFSFAFTFDAMPVFDLPNYDGFVVEEEEISVGDDEIDAVIEQARTSFAVPKAIDAKRTPRDGDIVALDFAFYDEKGETALPGFKAENTQMHLGQKQAMPEFEEVIKTVCSGEEGEGRVDFADDFPNPELAGKKTLVKVKIHSISELDLPEVNDEFAGRIGQFENVKAMRDTIRDTFTQSKKQQAVALAQKNMIDSLIKMTDFPLPPSLVERYVRMSVMDTFKSVRKAGKSLEEVGLNTDTLQADAKKEAENYVRTYIFLYRVAQAENITVSEDDLIAELRQIAAGQRRQFEEVRDEYVKKNKLGALHERIMADKAVQSVYGKASVTYVRPEKTGNKDSAGQDEKAQGKSEVKKTSARKGGAAHESDRTEKDAEKKSSAKKVNK